MDHHHHHHHPQVFPQLYLPVMTEANRRVLRPYRMYLPTPEWFRFRSRMQQLNTFLIDLFRCRGAAARPVLACVKDSRAPPSLLSSSACSHASSLPALPCL